MDFVCVLSVHGSLVSYMVSKKGENKFKAVLRRQNGARRDNVPEVFELEKKDNKWSSQPWDEEIVPGLTHCIDATV